MKKNEIMIYEQRCSRTLLSISDISRLVGVHADLVDRFFQHGLIDPQVKEPEPLFEDKVLVRVRKIVRFREDLGINLSGCGLVLDLLDRIAQLEQQLLHHSRRYKRLNF